MKETPSAQCVGRWLTILPQFGVNPKFLRARHGPCPICGGKDRFRFDDRDGKGTWICSHCGAGDGFKLLMVLNRWDFKEAWQKIEPVLAGIVAMRPRKKRDDEVLAKMVINMWDAGKPLVAGDPVQLYLARRGITVIPDDVRYLERCRYQGETGVSWMPAMIAKVSNSDGSLATIHRTYLTLEGKKADVPDARKLMPLKVPSSTTIKLRPSGVALGIAEGIETALAASQMFKMPVWSAINSSRMLSFEPPLEVASLYIFGDNDVKYGGQSAAYNLAYRMATAPTGPRNVSVLIPDMPGFDWNDILMEK